MYMPYSLLGLIVLIIDIWVIIKVLQSGAQPLIKALWVVIVLLLPIIGPLLWLILGTRV